MKNIELKTKIINDKYTEYVYEAFDIQNKEESCVSIPMNLGEAKNFDWNIGVILGGSGSGKTTILKQIGGIKKGPEREKKMAALKQYVKNNRGTILKGFKISDLTNGLIA